MRPLPPGHASYDEAKQRLRVRRFLQASTFSILYLVVLGVYHAAGSVDFETLRTTSEAVIVLVAAIAAYALFVEYTRERGGVP